MRSFRQRIFHFYRRSGRLLPWRKTTDSYAISVSEFMLQQTQVARVIPKYLDWLTRWPSWQSLASAPAASVIRQWSGLGYNRRALYLHALARSVVHDFEGVLPHDPEQLRKLKGVGPYLSRSILIFAYNAPLAAIDTNIRRVIMQEFTLPPTASAALVESIAWRVLPPKRSRDWHNALMDFGSIVATAKETGIQPPSKQSRFAGSRREVRGRILAHLASHESISLRAIKQLATGTAHDEKQIVEAMIAEGLLVRRGRSVVFPV